MEIVEAINKQKQVLIKQYKKHEFDTIDLILYCLESSTVRSFTYKKEYYKKYKPISIFRSWLFKYLKDEMDNIKNEKDFSKLHSKAFNSLKKYWNSKDGGKPEDYKFYKLIDLFFKFLPRFRGLSEERSNWLFENANIPIDKFSLKSYTEYSNNSLDVPKNPSMKFVEDSKKYRKIQTEIKKLVYPHPVLLFDLFAWEEGHVKPTKFELEEYNKK